MSNKLVSVIKEQLLIKLPLCITEIKRKLLISLKTTESHALKFFPYSLKKSYASIHYRGSFLLKIFAYMALWVMGFLLILLLGIGGVAFITLAERKILGLSQLRLGPNKVTLRGILQPIADGLKLLIKQWIRPSFRQITLYNLSPGVLIVFFLFMWGFILPWQGNILLLKHNALLFFSLLGARAYAVILRGWRATRGFSKLGSLRGVLQRLSYEVTLILVFLRVLVLFGSFNFTRGLRLEVEFTLFWICTWFILTLIERNRAPFDLLEGERELIRGFNIEIGRLMFVYLFLREYGMVIVIARITSFIAVGDISLRLIVSFWILLIRRCFPRLRYDSLMRFIWQSILPLRGVMILITTFLRK